MLKTLLVVLAASFGTTAALFLAPPRITYSGLQGQIPFGTALKVTQDGSNIWSWHHTFTTTLEEKVLVDFDRNGRMDTENPCFRVLITDMQCAVPFNTDIQSGFEAWLEDDHGSIWSLTPAPAVPAIPSNNSRGASVSFHLATPLALTVSSGLKVRMSHLVPITVHLSGRLVNL